VTTINFFFVCFEIAAAINLVVVTGHNETIDRELLLRKMAQYGIKGAELSWFRSYLSNRSQETKFYEKISDAINVQLGVPQGYLLGPLLFIYSTLMISKMYFVTQN
jgi:hypothetical protein